MSEVQEAIKPHLFVGIPSRDGKVSVALHKYISALEVCAVQGILPFTMNVALVEGLTPVQYARNVLMRLALSVPKVTDMDRALLIDDDMLPDKTTSRILMSNADICVPRMFRFRHNGPSAMSEEENRPPEVACCATIFKNDGPNGEEMRYDIIPRLDADGAVRVDAAGTGCMMIRRHVIEDARMRVGDTDDDGTPAIFRLIQSATGHISEWEDVDFSLRASRLGYTVVADLGAHCGHRKSINLDAVAELVYRETAEKETAV